MTALLLLLDLYEQIVIAFALCMLIPLKGSHMRIVFAFLSLVLLLFTSVKILNSIIFYEGALVYIVIFLISIYLKIFSRKNFLYILVITGFVFYVVFSNASLCVTLVSSAMNLNAAEIYQNNAIYMFCVILSKVTLTIPALILHKINKQLDFVFHSKKWISLIIVEFLVFLTLNIFFAQTVNGMDNVLNSIGIFISLLLFIFVLIVFLVLNQESKEKEDLTYLMQKMDFEQKYYKDALNQYNEVRRIRHDLKYLKNQLMVCVANNDLNKIGEILSDDETINLSTETPIITGNSSLDYILNIKALDCQKKGCNIQFCIEHNNLSFMKETDIFVLIGNMIDNAIEHCSNADKHIKIMIGYQKGFIMIACSNPTDLLDISSNKNPLSTSKKDKFNHGYGMRSMKLITEKYDGIFSYKVENHTFIISSSFIVDLNN